MVTNGELLDFGGKARLGSLRGLPQLTRPSAHLAGFRKAQSERQDTPLRGQGCGSFVVASVAKCAISAKQRVTGAKM